MLIAPLLGAGFAIAGPLLTNIPVLTEAGAAHILHDVGSRAVAANAPSAIAVVDNSGLLRAFVRMDGTRLGSLELAIGKARSAALMQRPTAELEDNVTKCLTALATGGLTDLRGRAPEMVRGACVGAVGVAGSNEDAAIAAAVASGLDDVDDPVSRGPNADF